MTPMGRRDWNLLVLSSAYGDLLTPAQLQKILFLLGKNLPESVLGCDFYQFEPGAYGPFDATVFMDTQRLVDKGLARIFLSTRDSLGYGLFTATHAGMERARKLGAALPEGVQDYIGNVVRWACDQSFPSLIRSIYRAYPETALYGVFQDMKA
jgi:hypothetical protein